MSTPTEPRPPTSLRLAALTALVVGLIGLVWLGSLLGYLPSGAAPTPLLDRPAPDFVLPVVAGSGAGRERISLSALRGEVVVLDFWASWCAPCRESVPLLNRLRERHPSVHFYGVNIESDLPAPAVRAAHERFAAAFPSVQDPDWSLQAKFAVDHIPAVLVIDRAGIVRYQSRGVPQLAALSRQLAQLSGQPD